MNNRIKEVREHFKLTQTEFGERLGVSRDVIGNIEYNRLKNPKQKEPIIKLICSTFGVNEIWLRTGEGEMFQAMTENEELAAYAGDVLAAAPDDIRKRFLAAQAKWTPDMWAVFAKIVDSFTETKKPDTE
uniref:Helix-turn-helix domain protein n=1 Tax=Myoviridae sp. ctzS633 TaxID=2825212 RepID=A0A8S5PTW1_9CAUD|nr:MAG TPA: helix-turn-helix domain protein [Myoviridae sp. ctzS633]